MAAEIKDLRWISAYGIFGTGIASGFVWGLLSVADINLSSGQPLEIKMSYADLAAIMLASVGVIVTVLAVIMAILAFVGWKQLKEDTHTIAEETALKHITKLLGDDGKPSAFLIERVEALALNGLNPAGKEETTTTNGKIDPDWGNKNSEFGDDDN